MVRTVVGSVILCLVVFATGGAIALVKYRMIEAQISAPPPPEMPESVVMASAIPTSVRQEAVSIGTVLAPQSIRLRSELVGIVESIAMVSGSVAEPNDLLVQFDTSVEKAQLQSAMASKKIADSTFRRTKEAAQVNASTQLELEQSEAAVSQANAEVLRLEAVIRKKTLRAPFRARVGLFDIHPGQYLQEGTEIAMLQGIDSFVNVDFAMPQQVADELSPGDKISLRTSLENILAHITAIDSQADRLTRGVKARARVDNPPVSMQPNDSVRVQMEYGAAIEGVLIPSSALRRAPSGAYIFAVEEGEKGDLRARQQEVIAGRTVGDNVVIVGGLAAGQRVVADGSFKLREGSLLMDSNIATADLQKAGMQP
ncbi:MAG: efflux RND transporter periplasmic adaptor subunit [Planctomycetota bacterium]|nr:efflux RND transporter periplasmic adaptor subunit [Planctomycetota bacterium]